MRRVNYQSKLIRKIDRKPKVTFNQCKQITDTKLLFRRNLSLRKQRTREKQREENAKIRMRISKTKEKNLITIINIYAPHSGIVSKNPEKLTKFYDELENTRYNIESENASSLVLICGDFNARVGKSNAADPCIGSHARGTRNANGQALVDFCNLNNLFACNTAFQHPARHISTWETSKLNKNTYKIKHFYHQIDYVLCDRSRKQILRDARSYAGTRTFSDHRLVKVDMQIDPYIIYKPKKKSPHKVINESRLKREINICSEYKQKLASAITVTESDNASAQEKWDIMAKNIKSVAEDVLGLKQKTKQHKHTPDPDIQKLSDK